MLLSSHLSFSLPTSDILPFIADNGYPSPSQCHIPLSFLRTSILRNERRIWLCDASGVVVVGDGRKNVGPLGTKAPDTSLPRSSSHLIKSLTSRSNYLRTMHLGFPHNRRSIM